MINPFDIPDQPDPLKPLNPVADSRHEGWFVDVDNTKEAFDEFQNILGKDAAFERAGAMAIAIGDSQFGKTSLLNRCAFWLQREIESRTKVAQRAKKAHIIDLRFVASLVPDNVSTTERVNTACHHLMMTLHTGRHLTEQWKDEGLKDAGYVLPYLANTLDRNVVIIVLLPPTADVMDELFAYANLVPKRVVMLAETSFVTRLEEASGRLRRATTVPVFLRLGNLRPEDGPKLYKDRRERHASDRTIAEAAPEDLRWLVEAKPTSVGEFQQLLYELYDDVRRRQTPVQQLTRDMIAKFFISRTRFGGDQ